MSSLEQAQQALARSLDLPESTPQDRIIGAAITAIQAGHKHLKTADFSHLRGADCLKDCTIRATIKPPPGKKKQPPGRKTIETHSFLLATKSGYFKAALVRGLRAGSSEKMMAVELPDMEAFEALCFLVELSYGRTYLQDGHGDPLPHHTLVALIRVANMFDFTLCLEQCCDELLGHELLPGEALSTLDSLHGCLVGFDKGHESIRRLLVHAVREVGPLERLLPQGPFRPSSPIAVQDLSLGDLQALTSLDSLIFLLKSDDLRLHSENTPITLALLWLRHQPDDKWTFAWKQEAFHQILDSGAFRLHHVDVLYLNGFAVRSALAGDYRQRLGMLFPAQFFKELGEKGWGESQSVPRNRAVPGRSSSVTLDLNVTRAVWTSLRGLKPGTHLFCFIGLLAGFPLVLRAHMVEATVGQEVLYLGVGWSTGGLPNLSAGMAYAYEIPASVIMQATVSSISPYMVPMMGVREIHKEDECRGDQVFRIPLPEDFKRVGEVWLTMTVHMFLQQERD